MPLRREEVEGAAHRRWSRLYRCLVGAAEQETKRNGLIRRSTAQLKSGIEAVGLDSLENRTGSEVKRHHDALKAVEACLPCLL